MVSFPFSISQKDHSDLQEISVHPTSKNCFSATVIFLLLTQNHSKKTSKTAGWFFGRKDVQGFPQTYRLNLGIIFQVDGICLINDVSDVFVGTYTALLGIKRNYVVGFPLQDKC